MLVVSNAMAKSASSVVFWFTQHLLEQAFPKTGHEALSQLTRSGELGGGGCFVFPLDAKALRRLLQLVDEHGPTVVKTHYDLTPELRTMLQSGEIKATFCYRDPRDMILSAIDHHCRSIAEGRPVFEGFTSVAQSIEPARWWCKISCNWIESELACVLRYRDIVAHPRRQLSKLNDYLGLRVDEKTLDALAQHERAARRVGRNQFNKGQACRFPTEMDPHELLLCNRALGKYIARLGFAVDLPDDSKASAAALSEPVSAPDPAAPGHSNAA